MYKESYVVLTSICIFVFSFILSAIINKLLISIQVKKVYGQSINSYLLTNHQKKKNTPTLGGIGIVISILLSTIFYYYYYTKAYFIALICMLVVFFLIGFIDDFIKIKFKNFHGLSSYIRFFIETLSAVLCFIYLENHYDFSFVNLLGDYQIYLGALSVVFFILVIVGSANSVNLTDGLDGLSSSLFLLAIIPFIIFSINQKEYYLTYLLISSFGAVLGFILFNLHPSKLFMGDSGSLSLGALLGVSSLILHREFFLIISGGLFIFETLSVILQVTSFKLFKKRIFFMSPFHHHLEIKGYKEYQIVMYFFIFGVILLVISLFLFSIFG